MAWSRRSPRPAMRISRCGRIATAHAKASSVSVAALSAGWDSTAMCAFAQSSPAGETESRSPTSTSGTKPGGTGVVEAAIGGDDAVGAGNCSDGDGVERGATGRHHHRVDRSFWHLFLRRHYPDQVLGSAAAAALSAH